MARKLKAHVIVERWTSGSTFAPERGIRCRCGWWNKHYNASYLTQLFKEHQANVERKDAEASS